MLLGSHRATVNPDRPTSRTMRKLGYMQGSTPALAFALAVCIRAAAREQWVRH